MSKIDFSQLVKMTQKQKGKKKNVSFMNIQNQQDSVISQSQYEIPKSKIHKRNESNIKKQTKSNFNEIANHQSNLVKSKPPNLKNITSTKLIQCLFAYVKRVKLTPTVLVEDLLKRQKKYDSNNQNIYYPFYPKDLNFSVKTKQGKKGVRDLIKYLQDLQTKQSDHIVKQVKLEWSHQLHQAAMKRAEAIEKQNSRVQNIDVGQLVSQFGYWRIYLSQIIVYGFIDPKQILIEAFLEDDSQQKNNRQQFFKDLGKYVGIGMASHPVYQVVTVIIFAGGVTKLQQFSSSSSYPSQQHCECNIY